MAKKTSRSEANDSTAAVTPEKRGARARTAPEQHWTGRNDPTEQDIRDRAYQMYLERGAHHGGDFDDWLRAEDELKQRR